MKVKRYVRLSLLSVFISGQSVADISATLQSALESAMREYKISDLSVSVVRSGETIYVSDLHLQPDGRLRVGSGDTQYRIASISKVFTAQAVLQLQEKGKLSLDDNVYTYIPSLSNSDIKIRDLLTHHAGFKDKIWPENFDRKSNFDTYLSKVLSENKSIKAGSNYQYSDTGFNILGKIISNISNMDYETYIERKILEPARMQNSGYYSGLKGLHPTVEPFRNGFLIPLDQRWPYDPQFFPSEGLISNVSDLTRWIRLVMKMDSKLLKKNSFKQMLTPQFDTSLAETQIGFSWFITRRNNLEYVYHMGGIRGYESIIATQPKIGNATIILANSNDVPRWEIVHLIEQTIE